MKKGGGIKLGKAYLKEEIESLINDSNGGISMRKAKLRLRAHHFLCMQGFQGYGYSDDFVKNMTEVVKYLKKNEGSNIILVDECDDICRACPRNANGECIDSNKVNTMDKKVLEKLNLQAGNEISPGELIAMVNKRLKNKKEAQDVCGECSWHKKCLWFLRV